jgi:hypothetical protein
MKQFIYSIVLFLFLASSLAAQDERFYYVSPTGKNTYTGLDEEHPLKTFDEVRARVRTFLQTNPGTKVTVYFAGGVYPATAVVKFMSNDSGTAAAPVTYKAKDGEIPIFLGSKDITGWTPGSHERIPASAAGKIYVADLSTSTFPNLGSPTLLSNHAEQNDRPEVFCNDQVQTLARWPNAFAENSQDEFVKVASIVGTTPVNSGWMEGIFTYSDPRQDAWATEFDPCFAGYWYYDWVGEFQKVESWDVPNKKVTLAKPWSHYGYVYDAGTYPFRARYYGFNLLCELDQPGEYYIDRVTRKIYWYPPEGVDPATAEVRMSTFRDSYMVEMNNCSHVRLEGLTFCESRRSGIAILDGSNVEIVDCRIERMGSNGIDINGGSNHALTGCLVRYISSTGMNVTGGDRKTLTSSNHRVENNVLEHISYFDIWFPSVLKAAGVGVRVANNRLQFAKAGAVSMSGNDLIFEYNQISYIGTEQDEYGGWDMFGNPSYRGNIVRYNHFSNLHGGTSLGIIGARCDDYVSGVWFYNNLFEHLETHNNPRDGIAGIVLHGGKDNIVENNFFYHCDLGVAYSSIPTYLAALESAAMKKMLYEDVDITSPLYLGRYPALAEIKEKVFFNTVINNILVNTEDYSNELYTCPVDERNNISIKNATGDNTVSLETALSEYNMQPLPFDQIGPKNNKWLDGFDPSLGTIYNPATASTFPALSSATFAVKRISQAPSIALADYTGTPFHLNQPTNVTPWSMPGALECEYFDRGDNGMAYHEKDDINQGTATIRPDAPGVDIANNSGAGGNVIGWSPNTDWYRYTVNVTKDAWYQASLRGGSTDYGRFYNTNDGAEGNVGWGINGVAGKDYKYYPSVAPVYLKQGKYVITLAGSGFNLDKIQLSETDPPSGISLPKEADKLFYYNQKEDYIRFTVQNGNASIYDLLGRNVLSTVISSNGWDVSSLKPGVYVTCVKTADGKEQTGKWVKQ